MMKTFCLRGKRLYASTADQSLSLQLWKQQDPTFLWRTRELQLSFGRPKSLWLRSEHSWRCLKARSGAFWSLQRPIHRCPSWTTSTWRTWWSPRQGGWRLSLPTRATPPSTSQWPRPTTTQWVLFRAEISSTKLYFTFFCVTGQVQGRILYISDHHNNIL